MAKDTINKLKLRVYNFFMRCIGYKPYLYNNSTNKYEYIKTKELNRLTREINVEQLIRNIHYSVTDEDIQKANKYNNIWFHHNPNLSSFFAEQRTLKEIRKNNLDD